MKTPEEIKKELSQLQLKATCNGATGVPLNYNNREISLGYLNDLKDLDIENFNKLEKQLRSIHDLKSSKRRLWDR